MKVALVKLHIAVLLAGFTAILGKLITLGEAPLVWWRFLITVAVMSVWAFVNRKKYYCLPQLKISLLGVGALIGLHWLCFFGSVKYANVSIALVCLSASGFFSSILEPFINKKKFKPVESLLGFVSMIGICIIFYFNVNFKTGILLGISSAVFSSLFSILNKKIIHKIDHINMITYEMLGGFLTLSAIVLLYMRADSTVLWPTGLDWLWLFILSFICTILAFFLQLQSLKYISAFTLTLSYNMEPIYGIIFAFVFFHENEQLSSRFYIGVVLILLSIIVQIWRIKRGNAINKI